VIGSAGRLDPRGVEPPEPPWIRYWVFSYLIIEYLIL